MEDLKASSGENAECLNRKSPSPENNMDFPTAATDQS